MIRNGPLKISKSPKKAENGPFGKNLFPITVVQDIVMSKVNLNFSQKSVKDHNQGHIFKIHGTIRKFLS